jgi:small subunit ribosomal protein S16
MSGSNDDALDRSGSHHCPRLYYSAPPLQSDVSLNEIVHIRFKRIIVSVGRRAYAKQKESPLPPPLLFTAWREEQRMAITIESINPHQGHQQNSFHIMVVRLRLQRFGRAHSPFYRMVAANARAPRDGKFLEIVGTYNPIANRSGMKEIRLKEDRLRYWLAVGAQPTDRVAWILGKFGILPPPPRGYNPQKAKARKDAAEAGSD